MLPFALKGNPDHVFMNTQLRSSSVVVVTDDAIPT